MDSQLTTLDSTNNINNIAASVSPAISLFSIVLAILILVALWKIFTKAGKPGWAIIVPVYNIWVLFEIVGYPGWWSVLSFVPIANFFTTIMIFVSYFKLGKLFGKGTGFSICLVLFPYITLPILGFGKSQFSGAPIQSPTTPVQDSTPVQGSTPQATTTNPTTGPNSVDKDIK